MFFGSCPSAALSLMAAAGKSPASCSLPASATSRSTGSSQPATTPSAPSAITTIDARRSQADKALLIKEELNKSVRSMMYVDRNGSSHDTHRQANTLLAQQNWPSQRKGRACATGSAVGVDC